MKKEKMKKQKQHGGSSIKTKLVCVILPVIGVILAVLVVFSYSMSSRIISGTSAQLLESSVASQKASIEAWLEDNLAAFNMLKHTIENTKPSDKKLQTMLDGSAGYASNYPEGL